MIYRPVVDRFVFPVFLDPLSAVLFVAAFAAAAMLAARRPAYGLAALILSIPFAFSHDFAGTSLTLQKSVLLGVIVGLTTYPGIAAALRKPPAAPLFAALALYVGVFALTLIDAAHRGAALRETFKGVEYAALFAVAFCAYRIDPDDALLAGAFSVAAIAVALSALAQEVVGAPSGLYVGAAIVPRIAGLLEGPNQLSAYAEIVVAALGAWALVRRTTLLDYALLLMVCADVLTFSRAGLFGLAVIAVVLFAAGGKATLRAVRAAATGLVLGALGCAWWIVYAHAPGVLRVSLAPSLYAGGVGNRDELWRAAWQMWRSHPLLGVGAGNYELELPRYGVFGVRTHANSWYLQSLAEGGIVLFVATLGVLAAIFVTLLRSRSLQSLRAGSPWIVAAVAATLALALHQIVDYLVFYPKVGAAWWILLGIGVAALSSRA